jgi:hypothetical protein
MRWRPGSESRLTSPRSQTATLPGSTPRRRPSSAASRNPEVRSRKMPRWSTLNSGGSGRSAFFSPRRSPAHASRCGSCPGGCPPSAAPRPLRSCVRLYACSSSPARPTPAGTRLPARDLTCVPNLRLLRPSTTASLLEPPLPPERIAAMASAPTPGGSALVEVRAEGELNGVARDGCVASVVSRN